MAIATAFDVWWDGLLPEQQRAVITMARIIERANRNNPGQPSQLGVSLRRLTSEDIAEATLHQIVTGTIIIREDQNLRFSSEDIARLVLERAHESA